ncbi:MAG: hypothetical protein Q7U04_08295, partial [Bacteriovorax sp.]|nr:hypothetical protein [Bacteriovorax sp.]
MKLKTSPLFLLNQFYKFIGFVLIAICLGSFTTKAFAEDSPGIVESLERLLDVHRKQYQQNKNKLQSNLQVLSTIGDLKDTKFDSQFIRSIIFHSDEKYLKLAQKDECKFLSVLESNLLKTAEGDINSVLLTFYSKDKKLESVAIPKNDYFEQIYKSKCLNNREFSVLFSQDNFQKTIEGIKFSVPKNSAECETIHKEWLDNSFTPYLCQIQQILRKSKDPKLADLYKEKIPTNKKIYLDNLCNNINSSKKFCENYLKNDVWSKVINGEAPTYKLSYKCQNLLGKNENLSNADMANCAAKLISTPSICETKGASNYPSNFPLQN